MKHRRGNAGVYISLIFGIVFLFVMMGTLSTTTIVTSNEGLHNVVVAVSTNLASFSDLIGLSIALAVVMGLISLGAMKMKGSGF